MDIWRRRDAGQPDEETASPNIQGGRERGLILHKLLEEVLTRETADDAASLTERALALIAAMGKPGVDDPSQGLSVKELTGCIYLRKSCSLGLSAV
jgi:hypothetical protein